jgi:Peptidase family C78
MKSSSHHCTCNIKVGLLLAAKSFVKLPLQTGHSRTIVGVEHLKDGGINLLVFDPSHTPQQMNQLHGTATSASGLRLIRKSLAAMKARQYQVVAITGIMDTEYDYQVSTFKCYISKNFKCNFFPAKQNPSFH